MNIRSASDLAHGLNDKLKLDLTARPWNIYSPSETFWWLVPSTDWPAYRYGKLAFSSARDVPRRTLLHTGHPALAPGDLFAGFNVEKGYGQPATIVNPRLKRKPAQFLDPSWLWFELMTPAGAAQFTRTLATASSKAKIVAYVEVGYVHDRDDSQPAKHDAVMFKCEGQGLSWITDNGFPINQLHGAASATAFAELVEHLRPTDDYHWVDLYVGTHVPPGDVNLADLHASVTSCFEAWLK